MPNESAMSCLSIKTIVKTPGPIFIYSQSKPMIPTGLPVDVKAHISSPRCETEGPNRQSNACDEMRSLYTKERKACRWYQAGRKDGMKN